MTPSSTSVRRLGWLLAPLALLAATLVSTPAAQAVPTKCPVDVAFAGGTGSDADPYEVATADQLARIAFDDTYWGNHFVQTADIDLASCGWSPIGNDTTPFTGSFDGAGFSISNLFFDDGDAGNIGLFGVTFAPGSVVVTDVHLVAVDITAKNNVGAIAGTNGGIITRSSASGTVTGGAEVNTNGLIGGLVGENGRRVGEIRHPALISYSLSRVDVTSVGGRFVGGLAGYNRQNSSIIDSYARGTVTGQPIDSTFGPVNFTAGFAGYNGENSTISNSYATGAVTSSGPDVAGFLGQNDIDTPPGVVTASYWDIATTGLLTSDGGTGAPTSDMTSIGTFEGAGWAIVAGWAPFEPTGTVWGICPEINDGYPYLLWEYTTAACAAPAPVPKFTG